MTICKAKKKMLSKRAATAKTTPFSSRVQECWQLMLHGSRIIILSSHGKRLPRSEREKLLFLDHSMEFVSYKPSKKKQNKFEISSILNIQRGENVREIFRRRRARHSIKSCISITFINREPLNIITESPQDAKCWFRGLQVLIENKINRKEYEKRRKVWLKELFQSSNKAGKQKLDFYSLTELFKSLGMEVNSSYFIAKLREFSEDSNSNCLSEEEYFQFLSSAWSNREIVSVMKRYAANGACMRAEDLEFFLKKEQGENVGIPYCENIIDYYEPTCEGKTRKELGIDGLALYLLSRENDIFNPHHDNVYQDMTQPLPHYFISSSHNTFLEGHQLRGESSIETYVNTLRLGCRCVEIDCWDGYDNEPVVYHGYTFTSKILFRDIIYAIRDHAFDVTPYPLILSLQVRCSKEAQKKMAQYMKEILGDKLYQDSVDTELKTFPSPEFFKYKVLVKNKKLKPEAEKDDDVDQDDVTDSEKKESNFRKKKLPIVPKIYGLGKHTSNNSLTSKILRRSIESQSSSEG